MSGAEVEERLGQPVVSRLACHSFDCRDESMLVFLGRTQRGTPVSLNRLAVEADLRILVGTIEPHPQAGFGGGYKNLLPGLAGAESIGANHLLTLAPNRYNMIGTSPEENPMRQDLEEACGMIAGATFILNVVLNPQLEPVAVVAGDPIAAHRAGIEVARQIYEVSLPHQADVVLSNAYPMDRDLRQAGKSILNVAGACRRGGLIVGLFRCEQGLGNVQLPSIYPPLGLTRALLRALGSRNIAFLCSHLPRRVPVETRFLIKLGLQILKDHQVLIFSPRLKEKAGDRFPPILYDRFQPLYADVSRRIGKENPEVAVFGQGGVSFPRVESTN
jgi:hypothetical protein